MVKFVLYNQLIDNSCSYHRFPLAFAELTSTSTQSIQTSITSFSYEDQLILYYLPVHCCML